jgi:hypothetical protein
MRDWGDFLESSGGAGNEKDARQVSGHCVFLNVRISLRGFERKRAVAGRPQHSVSAQRYRHIKLGVSVHFLSFLVCTPRFHLLESRYGAKYSIGI